MAYSVASDLVVHCLPMAHTIDVRLLCADVDWSVIFLDKAQMKMLHNIDTIAAC